MTATATEAHTYREAENKLVVQELADGRRRVSSDFPAKAWVTNYPLDLIERIVEVKGVMWAVDEIAREEDPNYMTHSLRHALLEFVPAQAFVGKRLLDFGCGAGSSTVALQRMLPDTEVVGVGLDDPLLELARARAGYYGMTLRFLGSANRRSLPADLGRFDFVNLGAVYEHLLPDERRWLLPRLWELLPDGGVLFISELPHRWYPIEYHTTGIPLLNYLPDRLTLALSRRFAPEVPADSDFDFLLQMGTRGGTAREVENHLGVRARRLSPLEGDHADLWYRTRTAEAPNPIKALMRDVFKLLSRLSGQPFVPSLRLAYQKVE